MIWLAPVFTATEHRDTETPRRHIKYSLGASVPRWFVAADDAPELWQ